jgi:hypothetical protein
MLGSNQRPPPCRDGALPAELIAREGCKCSGGTWGHQARARGRFRTVKAVAASLVLAGALAGTASARSPAVAVKPGWGSPKTHFVVTFIAPRTAGTSGGSFSPYIVSASGHQGRHCASATRALVAHARRGQRVAVTLVAPGRSHTWCRGTFAGSVSQMIRPECGPRELCPMFIALVPVGRFEFRVS